MASFVDELNNICKGDCDKCETKACKSNSVDVVFVADPNSVDVVFVADPNETKI